MEIFLLMVKIIILLSNYYKIIIIIIVKRIFAVTEYFYISWLTIQDQSHLSTITNFRIDEVIIIMALLASPLKTATSVAINHHYSYHPENPAAPLD